MKSFKKNLFIIGSFLLVLQFSNLTAMEERFYNPFGGRTQNQSLIQVRTNNSNIDAALNANCMPTKFLEIFNNTKIGIKPLVLFINNKTDVDLFLKKNSLLDLDLSVPQEKIIDSLKPGKIHLWITNHVPPIFIKFKKTAKDYVAEYLSKNSIKIKNLINDENNNTAELNFENNQNNSNSIKIPSKTTARIIIFIGKDDLARMTNPKDPLEPILNFELVKKGSI